MQRNRLNYVVTTLLQSPGSWILHFLCWIQISVVVRGGMKWSFGWWHHDDIIMTSSHCWSFSRRYVIGHWPNAKYKKHVWISRIKCFYAALQTSCVIYIYGLALSSALSNRFQVIMQLRTFCACVFFAFRNGNNFARDSAALSWYANKHATTGLDPRRERLLSDSCSFLSPSFAAASYMGGSPPKVLRQRGWAMPVEEITSQS